MAAAAIAYAVGGIHVFNHRKVPARFPFAERRLMRVGMAPPANLSRKFDARPRGRIIGVRGMVRRGTVAILALNSGQLRRFGFTHKTRRQSITNGVTREAIWIRILMGRLERLKRVRVARVHFRIVNVSMALRACLRARVMRRRAGHSEKSVAVNRRNCCRPQ